ncbi:hypothetical protein ACS0TY_028696 [Phlomoides rotata]
MRVSLTKKASVSTEARKTNGGAPSLRRKLFERSVNKYRGSIWMISTRNKPTMAKVRVTRVK